jgi:hypothetical protein
MLPPGCFSKLREGGIASAALPFCQLGAICKSTSFLLRRMKCRPPVNGQAHNKQAPEPNDFWNEWKSESGPDYDAK